jgi:hypothetical protein
MPNPRLSMRQIREVLRLRQQGLSERVIARTLGLSNGVFHGYLFRARMAGLGLAAAEGLGDEDLELLLIPAPTTSQADSRPVPDWGYVEKELRRRSVTRLLLWEEHRAANPDGFGYTWFCTTFDAWKKRAMSFEERVGLLVDREAAERDTKRFATRLKSAALRQNACIEDVDLRTPRGIDHAVFAKLIAGDWIDRHENLLITAATGRGKS